MTVGYRSVTFDVMLLRAFTERLSGLRRDARALGAVFGGRRRAPFRTSDRKPERDALAPRALRVVEVVRETRDAVSLVMIDESGAAIAFVPGQFLTLLVDIDGETFRRAYSISSDPRDARRVAVTVKRVGGGKVSNHLNDRAAVGDVVRVLGPSGSFVIDDRGPSGAARRALLIGGGSGITPLVPMATALLTRDPTALVTLLYGNRTAADILFRDRLDALRATFGERFHVRHVLEQPHDDLAAGGGKIDRDVAARELDALKALEPAGAVEVFVCGPEPMRAAVREVLRARGVDDARVHEERFASPAAPPVSGAALAGLVSIRGKNGERSVLVGSGQTILEAGLAAGLPMPFSCAVGGCGACKVKLVGGAVAMDDSGGLTREEREAGYVLACVARACESRDGAPCLVELP